jgi:hypothetical protein
MSRHALLFLLAAIALLIAFLALALPGAPAWAAYIALGTALGLAIGAVA